VSVASAAVKGSDVRKQNRQVSRLPASSVGLDERPTDSLRRIGLPEATFKRYVAFGRRSMNNQLKSLILAQIERWRHG